MGSLSSPAMTARLVNGPVLFKPFTMDELRAAVAHVLAI